MAWSEVGSLRGPAGKTGPSGPQGPSGSPPKYHGSLRWGNLSWYNPPANTFHRLDATGTPKMVVYKNFGGVAQISGIYARLYTPVAGVWLLSATQTWGGVQVSRGMGLARSNTDGASGVELWTDDETFEHVTVSRACFLEAGVYLYPWTWNGQNSGMSWGSRGYFSEYSATLLQAA